MTLGDPFEDFGVGGTNRCGGTHPVRFHQPPFERKVCSVQGLLEIQDTHRPRTLQ